ncbi:Acyl-protein thioesterase 1-like protein 1 [Diplonema papillatum]|nr:Acyl-protein thioesterase 1-like protein 1 [Diplonema papillatum]
MPAVPIEGLDEARNIYQVGPCEGYSHEASVIILHGYGDSAAGWYPAALYLAEQLRTVRFLLPTAPIDAKRDVTSWWKFDSETPAAAVASIAAIVAVEKKKVQQVGLMGFSQGAALSLACVCSGEVTGLSAVVSLAGWLVVNDAMRKKLGPGPHGTPVLLSHGEADDVVKVKSGKSALKKLQEAGFSNVELSVLPGLGHSITEEQLLSTARFFAKHLGVQSQSKL